MKRLRAAFAYWLTPRSLRFQLLARSLLIVAVLLMLIGFLQYVFMKDFLYRNEADKLSLNAKFPPMEMMEEAGLSFGPDRRSDNNEGPGGGNKNRGPFLVLDDTSLAFISKDGTFNDITGANNGTASPRLSAAEYTDILAQPRSPGRGSGVTYRVVSNAQGIEQLVVFRHNGGPGGLNGVIQFGTPTAPLKAVVLQQLVIFIALSVVALACGLALNLPVLRKTLRPLQHMVKTVEKTNAGNLDERIPTGQGQEEIDRLAESFNSMLGRLAESFEAEREAKNQMKRFIADASHELRTPLTSIHGFLEVLLRGAADKREQLYMALNSMHGESTRIKRLVEDLLMLAKLDNAPGLSIRPVHLNELISEMEPHLRMLAGSRTLVLDRNAGTDLVAEVDPDKMKQIILNLYHNAVQHTDPERGVLSIRVREDSGQAFIEVGDNGPGIEEVHLPHLFERFYRSDFSRTRKQGGSGLGLSISKSLAEAHGGDIEVVSKVGAGSTFTLRLPLRSSLVG
ncbi:sensor histidine kinase [Paenibacillus turpanensis]|uniref:sensor histidine kinase n=1 Tax=Paenibacillus turpanensis TaxID=2689078 RepID=UPI0014094334|nr:HAMP domain-containing sensor histidine kinase [Paenibacillus turpanensis]